MIEPQQNRIPVIKQLMTSVDDNILKAITVDRKVQASQK